MAADRKRLFPPHYPNLAGRGVFLVSCFFNFVVTFNMIWWSLVRTVILVVMTILFQIRY